MHRSFLSAAAAAILLALPAGAQSRLSQLAWMAGCHELRVGSRLVHEVWMGPLAGMMMGMSRTVVRDSVREFENVRITESAQGLAYIAKPSGQPEATFPAEFVSDTLVRFANPAHDYPQRIIYRRASADSIVARIEGTSRGRTSGSDYPMRRVACA